LEIALEVSDVMRNSVTVLVVIGEGGGATGTTGKKRGKKK